MVKKSKDTMAENLQPVTKTKFHEQIVAQVRALIEKGGLKHGDQLPAERELASIFKVSRHSVREAIRVLEQQQVVKSRPGSGTFIILENESSVVESLAGAILREKIPWQRSFNSENCWSHRSPGLLPATPRNKISKDWKTLLAGSKKNSIMS